MDLRTSVFSRNSRDKKTKQLDDAGNQKTVKVKGGWVYRIRYTDHDGRARCLERGGFSRKSDARDALNAKVVDLRKSAGHIRTGERMTFERLADICEATFYRPAEIVDGRKIAGVRAAAKIKSHIRSLRAFFGPRLINNIATEHLVAYRVHRMKPKSTKVFAVAIATVNRELAAMRRMMRFAFQKGWVVKDVFYNAQVIELAGEVARTRVLTRDEEGRLLASCQGDRLVEYTRTIRGRKNVVHATVSLDNPHLKAMILLAVDCALRRGEIFKLRWEDVDFDGRLIRVVGTHTKTQVERLAPLSDRARAELLSLRELSPARPFPFTDIKRSFATAKRLAGIEDLHFHDLRRTAITRWLQAGTPLAFAGKIAGHSQLQTTVKHYTAADASAVKEVNDRLDRANARPHDSGETPLDGVIESSSVN